MAPKNTKKEEGGAIDEPVVEVDELTASSASAPATGEFYVKQVAEGKFRLYNEFGQAVSPVTTEPLSINKAASRSNALRQARIIK